MKRKMTEKTEGDLGDASEKDPGPQWSERVRRLGGDCPLMSGPHKRFLQAQVLSYMPLEIT